MAYLQNPNQADLLPQILQWVESDQPDQTYLLLIDGALLTNEHHDQRRLLQPECQCLLDGTAFASFKQYGLLGHYFTRSELTTQLDWLNAYLSLCSGLPALSIIRLKGQPNTEFWHWLSDLHLKDDPQSFVLRFADTHVLPNFLNVLGKVIPSNVAHYVSEWAWTNRQGDWQIQTFAEWQNVPINHKLPFTLTLAQFNQLLDLSEVDVLYAMALEQELKVKQKTPYDTYQYLDYLNKSMQRFHIAKSSEQQVFLKLMLASGYRILTELPELEEAWHRLAQKEHSLLQEINTWHEDVFMKINQIKATQD